MRKYTCNACGSTCTVEIENSFRLAQSKCLLFPKKYLKLERIAPNFVEDTLKQRLRSEYKRIVEPETDTNHLILVMKSSILNLLLPEIHSLCAQGTSISAHGFIYGNVPHIDKVKSHLHKRIFDEVL